MSVSRPAPRARIQSRPRRSARLLAVVAAGLAAGVLALAGPATGSRAAPAARVPSASALVPPLYLGLDSYLHLDKLSYLEVGDRVAGWSAADPGGSDYIVHTLDLLHQAGPGIVTSMRMHQTSGSPWSLTTDGTTLGFGPTDLGSSGGNVFPYPLALNPSQDEGSAIINTPVAFSRMIDLRSTSTRDANFDGIYRKLPYGTPLPADSALSPANPAMQRVVSLLKSAGTDIAPTGLPSVSGTISLGAAGAPTPLTVISGADQLRSITISVPLSEAVQLGNSTLQITWDGESTPDVSAPLKFLAGDGAGVYQPAGRQLVQGLLAGISSDGSTYVSYHLYYPMPFARSASIAIVPDDASAGLASVSWSVSYQPFTAPAGWWGYFHANYTSIAQPTLNQNMTFLDYRGSGKLVGTVVNFGAIGTVLEGGPQIFIDNSQTPQIAYTGTEEWGLGGNYWDGGVQDSLPLGGLPSSTNNPAGTDIEGAAMYRFLIADSIAFSNQIVVQWEHGGTDNVQSPYSASMMWYGTPVPSAIRTDSLTVGDPLSASAHHYVSPGQMLFPLTAGYEYQPYVPLITGTVAKTSGSATFTMRLAAGNAGAFLRRTFDSCVAGQRAAVYVDGEYAGTWYNSGVSSGTGWDGHLRCWRDDDFPLPASLTAGRTSITIRIQHPGASSYWTASSYKLYSFVMRG